MRASPVFQWGKNFIDRIDLKNSKTILDVGCRTGGLSAYLAKQYKKQHIFAIDNVKAEIEQTRSHRLPNLSFDTLDILHLDHSNTFDAVVSLSCFHWVNNKYQALKNIYQSLKPGGKAYLQFFVLHGRLKNDRFIYQTARSSNWKKYFNICLPTYSEITITDVNFILQKVGFLVHRLEIMKYNTPFNNADHLQNWFSTWASQANYVPKKKRNDFLNDVTYHYLDTYQHAYDAPFPYEEYVLEIICEKPVELVPLTNMNKIRLTNREQDILNSYLQGKTAKEIAIAYAVSSKTVEFHLANIKKKMNCYRRSDIYEAAHSFLQS